MGTTVDLPNVDIQLLSADQDQSNQPQRVLLFGQMLAAGTHAGANTLRENIPNDAAIYEAEFGKTSQLAEMCRIFKSIAPQVRLDAVVVTETSAGAASWNLTMGGTATAAGTYTVMAGATRWTFTVDVAVGDAAASVQDAMVLLINANTQIPLTASQNASNLVLTSDIDGSTNMDSMAVSHSIPPAGLSATTIALSTGTGLPTFTTMFDNIGANRYQGIVWPWPTDAGLDALTAWTDPRFNQTNAIRDGVAFTTVVDTFANLVTALSGALAQNSQSLVSIQAKTENDTNEYLGNSIPELDWIVSTRVAAIRALRLTTGAPISRYLVSNASSDQFGGPALASLPYFNTILPGLGVIQAKHGFTSTEIASLKALGGAVVGSNPGGTGMLMGEMVTTYLLDGASNPDVTWTLLNYVDTASGCREYFFNNYKSGFAQTRLTTGKLTRGRAVTNEDMIRAESTRHYQTLGGPGYVLVQLDDEFVDSFKESLDITITMSTGNVAIAMDLPIVTQLRSITATIKIAFSTEG